MKESAYLKDQEHLLNKFQAVPFLHDFDADNLRDILGLSRLREYEDGEIIIEEGDEDRSLYILIHGEVAVTKGHSELSRLFQSGDVFGEMSFVSRKPRTATVTAKEKTHCLAIDASFIARLPKNDISNCESVVYKFCAQVIAQRLKQTSTQLAEAQEELLCLRKMIELT